MTSRTFSDIFALLNTIRYDKAARGVLHSTCIKTADGYISIKKTYTKSVRLLRRLHVRMCSDRFLDMTIVKSVRFVHNCDFGENAAKNLHLFYR